MNTAARSQSPREPMSPPWTPGLDLLRVPALGQLLRWRWGRLVFQLPLLGLALLIIYDGLTGPQLAPQNVATVAAWVHYRGLVILALLLFGNLFCMSCPFALPRTVAKRLSLHGWRWPRVLRNKWPAILLLVGMFWVYEWLDLWASPWLTAWVALAYFAAAFALEALFRESAFCKYICPLGTFNFAGSTVSPFQVVARSADVCRTCEGKECVNGKPAKGLESNPQVLGCGTELFVPQIRSNLDCVFCLDCARACPHDNVALAARPPLHELVSRAWPQRWDISFLVLVFAFAAVGNAFGMVPAVYALEARLANLLNTDNEALLLLLILGVLMLVLPAGLGLGAAWLSRWLEERARSANGNAAHVGGQDRPEPLRTVLSRYAPLFMPLAFAIWLAHYGFHFATGALTIVPVLQNFLIDHGIMLLGSRPNWALGPILPAQWLLPLQTVIIVVGFVASLYVANRVSLTSFLGRQASRAATLPWVLLLLGLALATMAIFTQPMEMRGTMELLS